MVQLVRFDVELHMEGQLSHGTPQDFLQAQPRLVPTFKPSSALWAASGSCIRPSR